MTLPTAVFELTKICDDKKYKGLAMSREISSLLGRACRSDDFVPQGTAASRNWTVDRLSEKWTDQPVLTGQLQEFNDYPCINLSIPAISKRAVEVLSEFLLPNGELLAVQSPVGEYFAYNLTTIADVLDLSRAQVKFLRPDAKARALSIDRFEFHENALSGYSVFRLVELPNAAFVTDRFVETVNQNGLKGFDFTKVWPFPEGVKWKEERLKQERSRKPIRK